MRGSEREPLFSNDAADGTIFVSSPHFQRLRFESRNTM